MLLTFFKLRPIFYKIIVFLSISTNFEWTFKILFSIHVKLSYFNSIPIQYLSMLIVRYSFNGWFIPNIPFQNCFHAHSKLLWVVKLLSCYWATFTYTILFIQYTWFLLVPSPVKIKDLLHKNLKKGDWGNNMKLGQKECKVDTKVMQGNNNV
jgi:hypothetical protein